MVAAVLSLHHACFSFLRMKKENCIMNIDMYISELKIINRKKNSLASFFFVVVVVVRLFSYFNKEEKRKEKLLEIYIEFLFDKHITNQFLLFRYTNHSRFVLLTLLVDQGQRKRSEREKKMFIHSFLVYIH